MPLRSLHHHILSSRNSLQQPDCLKVKGTIKYTSQKRAGVSLGKQTQNKESYQDNEGITTMVLSLSLAAAPRMTSVPWLVLRPFLPFSSRPCWRACFISCKMQFCCLGSLLDVSMCTPVASQASSVQWLLSDRWRCLVLAGLRTCYVLPYSMMPGITVSQFIISGFCVHPLRSDLGLVLFHIHNPFLIGIVKFQFCGTKEFWRWKVVVITGE